MQPPENHVAMMQIDCEVMNTRLLHIHEDSIPEHLSQAMRSNASLQRNDSNEDHAGVHHHPHSYDNGTKRHHGSKIYDPSYEQIRTPLYKKPISSEHRYVKPASLVQNHNFPRLPPPSKPSSSSSSFMSKKYNSKRSRAQLKLNHP